MNINELASLVTIRNHLKNLMEDRTLINKDKLQSFHTVRVGLDKLFLENICSATAQPSIPEINGTKTTLTVINGGTGENGAAGGTTKLATAMNNVEIKTSVILKDGVLIVNPNNDEQIGSLDEPTIAPVEATVLTSAEKELEASSTKIAPSNKKTAKIELTTTEEDQKALKASLAEAKKKLGNKKGGKGPTFKRDQTASED